MQLFDQSNFYLRRAWCANPALVVCVMSCIALFAAVTSAYFAGKKRAAEMPAPIAAGAPNIAVNAQAKNSGLDLPFFHAVPLVNAIERAAARAGVDAGEVTFTLEDTAIRPFLRYRASFTLVGRYPAVRELVADVSSTLNYVSLDSVHCLREDASAASVGCTMTISAMYRRGGHE